MSRRPEEQVIGVLGWVRCGSRVLLVRRHGPSTPDLHGAWELPGGKLHFGEAPEAAVAREVLEETGYRVDTIALLPHVYSQVWELPDRRRHVVLLTFECRAVERCGQPSDPKVAALAWRQPRTIDAATALPSVGVFLDWWRGWSARQPGRDAD